MNSRYGTSIGHRRVSPVCRSLPSASPREVNTGYWGKIYERYICRIWQDTRQKPSALCTHSDTLALNSLLNSALIWHLGGPWGLLAHSYGTRGNSGCQRALCGRPRMRRKAQDRPRIATSACPHLHECLHGALRYVQHRRPGPYEGPLVHRGRGVDEEHNDCHSGHERSGCHALSVWKGSEGHGGRATRAPLAMVARPRLKQTSLSLTSNKPSGMPTLPSSFFYTRADFRVLGKLLGCVDWSWGLICTLGCCVDLL